MVKERIIYQPKGKKPYVVELQSTKRDASAANVALALLHKELDRIEATRGRPALANATLPNRGAFEEAMQAYRQAGEVVRQAHAPKPNGSANGRRS
jgi:hypothetical protein